MAERTSESLTDIVNGITKVTDLISEIATASGEQAQGVSQINIGLQQIDQVIEQNTATAVESAATSEELAAQALTLKKDLSHFVLRKAQLTIAQQSPQSNSLQAPPADDNYNWAQ